MKFGTLGQPAFQMLATLRVWMLGLRSFWRVPCRPRRKYLLRKLRAHVLSRLHSLGHCAAPRCVSWVGVFIVLVVNLFGGIEDSA